MLKNFQKKRPCDGVESLGDIDLHKHGEVVSRLQPSTRQLHRAEVVVDGLTLDERALVLCESVSEPGSQPPRETLGEQLTKAVHQANRMEVLEVRGVVVFLSRIISASLSR